MRLNLKNARRLEQSIQLFIDDISDQFNNRVELSIYDHNAISTFNQAISDLEDSFDAAMQLTQLRFKIRDAISEINQSSELNTLMAEEANLKQQQHLTLELIRLGSCVTQDSITIIEGKLDAKKKPSLGDNRFSSSSDTVGIVAPIYEERYVELKKSVNELKRRKAQLADQCAAINLSKTIELSVDDTKLLQKFDLV